MNENIVADSSEAIDRCPFCGDISLCVNNGYDSVGFWLGCINSNCIGSLRYFCNITRETAIKSWNSHKAPEYISEIDSLQADILTLEKEKYEFARVCKYLQDWYEYFFSSAENFKSEEDSIENNLLNFAAREHEKFTKRWLIENPQIILPDNNDGLAKCLECGKPLTTFYCFFCRK